MKLIANHSDISIQKLGTLLIPSQLFEFTLGIPPFIDHQLVGLLAFDDDQKLAEESILL